MWNLWPVLRRQSCWESSGLRFAGRGRPSFVDTNENLTNLVLHSSYNFARLVTLTACCRGGTTECVISNPLSRLSCTVGALHTLDAVCAGRQTWGEVSCASAGKGCFWLCVPKTYMRT